MVRELLIILKVGDHFILVKLYTSHLKVTRSYILWPVLFLKESYSP